MKQIAEQLKATGRICNIINIQDFIKLLGEEVEDMLEDFIKHVAELYAGPNCNIETDEEVVEQPQIKLSEVLVALQKLCLYKEQQSNSDRDVITTLSRHKC